MRDIREVAADLGLARQDLLLYGDDIAKVKPGAIGEPRQEARLILVTAMSPSPAGEGKTTVAIGLANALRALGARTVVALREPSMGPVFGSKGGGAGAGKARVLPAESINLHFTGDMHAVTAAHNLLSAALDNHLHFGNALNLDVRRILWRRVMDQNDRALRQMVVGLGGKQQGVPREDRFDITAASEVMAILALSRDHADLKRRLERIVVAVDRSGKPVAAAALKAAGAQAALLRDALLPNLVQTCEGTPALVHCGPFANIAHGTSSIAATRLGLQRADLVVQEAGFGADLGAEKFLDIFCRELGRYPSLAVVVATARAVALHGMDNLRAHLENLARFGLPAVVALNEMDGDSPEDRERILAGAGVPAFPVRVFQEGSAGALELARHVANAGPPAAVTP
ncbi:MAG: formate--tetrahydrofolate ligase, partial [Candidatus Eremiobacterota bacterium]